ncbi:bombesin receptor subtype-3-like [Antedon mediterranea]|uniref:bombesin receptor subtype-3-like n=1 Tax=Antedon mediterranea TaxID=105859 RepID=UPI003AF643C1
MDFNNTSSTISSSYDYPGEFDPTSTLWQDFIVAMEITFIIVGIFGNTLLIFIIIANNNMHSAHNYLLVCLAIGDLLLLTLGVPIFVFKKITTYASFLHKSSIGCKLVHGCLVMAECVSIGTFTALSVDRYMVIRYRMTSCNSQSYRKYICICICIWFLAICISAPIFHQAYITELPLYGNMSLITCYPFVMHSNFAKTYQVTVAIIMYMIPLVLILICYSKMAFILMTSIRTNNVISQGSATDAMTRRRYLARSVLIMIVIFAICWLPLHASEIVRQYNDEDINFTVRQHPLMQLISNIKYLMIIFSACANPLVLFTVSKQFKRYLRQYFCCKKSIDLKHPKSFTLVPSYKKVGQIEKDTTRSTSL